MRHFTHYPQSPETNIIFFFNVEVPSVYFPIPEIASDFQKWKYGTQRTVLSHVLDAELQSERTYWSEI